MILETVPTSSISVSTASSMSVPVDTKTYVSLTEGSTLSIFEQVILLTYFLVHWYPLYIARISSRDRDSLLKYFFKISIIHSSVCFMVGLSCLLYTIIKYFDPENPLGKLFITMQFSECAYRLQELKCDTVLSTETRRECFALGMCVVQPTNLVKLQMIFDVFWEILWACRLVTINFDFTNRIRGALDEIDDWYNRHFVDY
ncbi:unnamed protein product [Diplocarpon coronariae]